MRIAIFVACCLLAAPNAHAADDERSFAFSLGGFSGDETSGIAVGVYSLRPDSIGWYVNATASSLVDDDDDFRPIPGDIRVDSDTDSVTLNIGLTLSLGRVATYVGVGVSSVAEYGLYRTPSFAYWYEEKSDTKGNLNAGLLFGITQNIGLDVGANSANDEITLGLNWRFR
jgi:hypothetical protein